MIVGHQQNMVDTNSAIHKAASLTVPDFSMISTSTIPVEQKRVHWLRQWEPPAGTAWGGEGGIPASAFWEGPVTKEPAALWIALLTVFPKHLKALNIDFFG